MEENNQFNDGRQPQRNPNPQGYYPPPPQNGQQPPPGYNYPPNGQQNWQQPPPPVQQEKPKAEGTSIVGLVLALIAFVMSFIGFVTFWTWLIGGILGIVAMILSVVGFKKQKEGVAISGIVFSVLSVAFNLIMFLACGLAILALGSAAGAF